MEIYNRCVGVQYDVLSDAQCDDIISRLEKHEVAAAEVTANYHRKESIDPKELLKNYEQATRKGYVVTKMGHNEFSDIVFTANKRIEQYTRIIPIQHSTKIELQSALYNEPGHWFEWHKDEAINYMSWDKQHQLKKIGRGTDYRKITAIFQLTDPDTYEGCDLEFEHGPMPDIRKRGTLIIFPSFVTHRVTKLISGMRRSYTVWYHGDIWK